MTDQRAGSRRSGSKAKETGLGGYGRASPIFPLPNLLYQSPIARIPSSSLIVDHCAKEIFGAGPRFDELIKFNSDVLVNVPALMPAFLINDLLEIKGHKYGYNSRNWLRN